MKTFIITTWATGLAIEFGRAFGLLGPGWDPIAALNMVTLVCLFFYRMGNGEGFPLQPSWPGLGWRWLVAIFAAEAVFFVTVIVVLDSPWDSALLLVPAMWLLNRPLVWVGRRVKYRQPGPHHAALIRHGITLARRDALEAGHTGAWQQMPAMIMVDSKRRARVERPWIGKQATLTNKHVVRGYTHEHLRKVRGLIHEAVAVLVKDMGGKL